MGTLAKTALCSFVIVGIAIASARIELRPWLCTPPDGHAPGTGQVLFVYLVDTGDSEEDIVLTHISLDLTDTFSQQDVYFVEQPDGNCFGCWSYVAWDIGFWGSLCRTCPDMLRPTWSELDEDLPGYMMPAGGEVGIGHLQFAVGQEGFLVDVMNADDPTPFHGAVAHVRWFPSGEEEIWSAQTGELTGGQFHVLVNTGTPNSIVWSDPPHNTIDARQPTNIDGSGEFGWDKIDLVFAQDICVENLDFRMDEIGGDDRAPQIASATFESPTELRAYFTDPIDPGAWTTIEHVTTGATMRLGYLPGDVNGDGTTSPVDILALIDALNGVTERPIWATDIDRSGVANPADILRLIDLLSGAGAFDVWNGAALP
jgi:hypothetical protein